MEMSAVLAGLYSAFKWLPKEKSCTVYSDSSLIIETMKKGWKRKKNLDLWQKLDSVIEHFDKIDWQWVRGHANTAGNIEADKIAFAEAAKRKKSLKSH